MADLLNKILRAGEGKTLRRLERTVREVNALEDEFAALSDEELRGKTEEFRERPEQGETLDDLLPEAFACVREALEAHARACARSTCRCMGGGRAAQGRRSPRCGPARARRSSRRMPLYLNALPGEGVHLVTVNDYLARRDADLDGPGVRGARHHGRRDPGGAWSPRRGARSTSATSPTAPTPSSASTTCATTSPNAIEQCVQRSHTYAIVDEVDSILIDEARTPLIISGQPEEAPDTYYTFAKIARKLGLRRRLRDRREAQDGRADRAGRAQGRARAQDREPVRARERPARQPPRSRPSRPSRCTSATSSTSCRTARSRSSTSSPAASWRAGAGRRACTRPSRRRRA